MAGNPVAGNQVQFPQRTQALVDDSQQVTTPWFLLLQALFARSGEQSGMVILTTQDKIADAGGGQAGATQLTLQCNFVNGAGGSVKLPPFTNGNPCVVFNIGGGGTNIYPPVLPAAQAPMQIDALGNNAAYALASGKCQIFWFENTTQIRSTQLG